MSEVNFQQMTLEELVNNSPVIVAAREMPDTIRHLTLELGPGIEPFGYTVRRWRVFEVLRGPAGPAPGNEFAMTSMTSGRLRSHVEYYIHRLSVGTIEAVYTSNPQLKDEPSAARILFLARHIYVVQDNSGRLAIKADGYSPVCTGAIESIARRDDVMRLSASRAPVPGCIEITVGTHGPADLERISTGLRELFPNEKSFSWNAIDLTGGR